MNQSQELLEVLPDSLLTLSSEQMAVYKEVRSASVQAMLKIFQEKIIPQVEPVFHHRRLHPDIQFQYSPPRELIPPLETTVTASFSWNDKFRLNLTLIDPAFIERQNFSQLFEHSHLTLGSYIPLILVRKHQPTIKLLLQDLGDNMFGPISHPLHPEVLKPHPRGINNLILEITRPDYPNTQPLNNPSVIARRSVGDKNFWPNLRTFIDKCLNKPRLLINLQPSSNGHRPPTKTSPPKPVYLLPPPTPKQPISPIKPPLPPVNPIIIHDYLTNDQMRARQLILDLQSARKFDKPGNRRKITKKPAD